MPYLYCAVHGRGHENRIIAQQDQYRQAGESVLLVHGPLKTGPHRCDRCNATLRKGDPATLLSAIPRHIALGTDDYAFAYEKRYFELKRVSVAVYGAPWPAVAEAGARR
jgi:hypothetical protein